MRRRPLSDWAPEGYKLKRSLTWMLLITTFASACATASLSSRWQTYQRERAQYEESCRASGAGPHYDAHGTPCHMLYYVRHFHKRWNELIGTVPASEALWAEHERMAREWGQEFVRHHKEGTPLRPANVWVEWGRATEEQYALPIAQQLADQEQTAELRRERALMALYALGLMASQVAAVATPSPRAYMYQVPPAPQPSKADPAVRREVEANWAVRTGGATGGAMNQYIRDALKQRATETCTYSLNALHGSMLCVDSQGNVRAR